MIFTHRLKLRHLPRSAQRILCTRCVQSLHLENKSYPSRKPQKALVASSRTGTVQAVWSGVCLAQGTVRILSVVYGQKATGQKANGQKATTLVFAGEISRNLSGQWRQCVCMFLIKTKSASPATTFFFVYRYPSTHNFSSPLLFLMISHSIWLRHWLRLTCAMCPYCMTQTYRTPTACSAIVFRITLA